MSVTHMLRSWRNQNSNYAIWIYILANSNSPFIFLFGQFINPNCVIRILITPATQHVRNRHNLFSNLFHICI